MSALDLIMLARESFDPKLHPRNPKGSPLGGKFRSLGKRIADAIAGGEDDPIATLSRPQLRAVAKERGVEIRPRAPEHEIRDALRSHYKSKSAPKKIVKKSDNAKPAPKKVAPTKAAPAPLDDPDLGTDITTRDVIEILTKQKAAPEDVVKNLVNSVGIDPDVARAYVAEVQELIKHRKAAARKAARKAAAGRAVAPDKPSSSSDAREIAKDLDIESFILDEIQARLDDGDSPADIAADLRKEAEGIRRAGVKRRGSIDHTDYRQSSVAATHGRWLRYNDLADRLEAAPRPAKKAKEAVDIILLAREAAGHDVTPGNDQLHHYWTQDPRGLAKWTKSPHPWTALYHHLVKFVGPERAKRMASEWFHDVFHIWSGERKGSNPVGPG